MNPLEYFGTLHTMLTDKIQTGNKETFTREEVIKLMDKLGENYRKAIFNSSYVFNIEELNGNVVSIKDEEYTIKKLLTEENKYLLFVQLGEREEPITDTDIQILAEAIQQGIAKSSNVSGVVIVPPNMDVSLITASLDRDVDIKGLEFTEDELTRLRKLQDEINETAYDYSTTSYSIPSYKIHKTEGMNRIYEKFFGGTTTSTSLTSWYK